MPRKNKEASAAKVEKAEEYLSGSSQNSEQSNSPLRGQKCFMYVLRAKARVTPFETGLCFSVLGSHYSEGFRSYTVRIRLFSSQEKTLNIVRRHHFLLFIQSCHRFSNLLTCSLTNGLKCSPMPQDVRTSLTSNTSPIVLALAFPKNFISQKFYLNPHQVLKVSHFLPKTH